MSFIVDLHRACVCACSFILFVTLDTMIMIGDSFVYGCALASSSKQLRLIKKKSLSSFSLCALVPFYLQTTLYFSWKARDWWTVVAGGFRGELGDQYQL